MGARPSFHSKIGQAFVDLRTGKGWKSQRQAANIAARRGLTRITQNIIWRMELGRIKHPKPEVLHEFATLFGKDYESLAGLFTSANYGTDPADVATGRSSTDAVQSPALRRVQELEEENERLHEIIDRVSIVAAELAVLAASDKKDPNAGRKMAGGSRGDRKDR